MLMRISRLEPPEGPTGGPSRGDTVEFTAKKDGKLTGTVTSAYVAKGTSARLTVLVGGKRRTCLASSATILRKATTPPENRGIGDHVGKPAPNAGRHFRAQALSQPEVTALIGQCSRHTPTGIRNRAMLMLLYRSGLRVSEIVAVRPSDVDLDANSIRLLDTKSSEAQTRGFFPEAADPLQLWLNKRRELKIRTGHLFCTLAGQPLSQEYVRVLLHRLGTNAGIDKRVHPHALRHTFAAELEAAGVPVSVISALLGHSGVGVTAAYLRHLTNKDAIKALVNAGLKPLGVEW